MARKNPFANLMDEPMPSNAEPVREYTTKGASKNMLGAIEDLAQQAERLLEGATVVDLDPGEVEVSFVRDRMTEDDPEEFAALLEAIKSRGQDSPILVRPHPDRPGKYMIVFGHRRYRVAKELGIKVRAVIKPLKDIDHVLAQGQENSARANLSYVEKAIYAGRLSDLNLDKDNAFILSALSIDASALSVMLSIAALPDAILEAIGPARKVGRPRWLALRKLLDRPALMEVARKVVSEGSFQSMESNERFAVLFDRLHNSDARRAKPKSAARRRSWTAVDKVVAAELVSDDRRFSLALKSNGADAREFGDYVVDRLEQLYAEFQQANKQEGTA